MGELQVTHRRRDIDGLRAIAVISVVLFHLGFLKFGYLGVDIFFVLSGYLIIGIINRESIQGKFSIARFYLKRTRRIIPLVLLSGIIALAVGYYTMLPDDFENLAQSVFATNFFSNNLLLFVTSKDYWAIVNDFKPLMHTWSLGVEEQFYILIPLLFLFLQGKKTKIATRFIIVATVASLVLFLTASDEATKFYMLPYRFFELGVGGIVAVIANGKQLRTRYSFVFYILLLVLLIAEFPILADLRLILIVVFTSILLATGKEEDLISTALFENGLAVWIGKISFSIYIWHQIILAFSRYFVIEIFYLTETILYFVILLLISVLSYYLVEQPFQKNTFFTTKRLLMVMGFVFLFSTTTSLYIYSISGVVRSVPELGMETQKNRQVLFDAKRNTHIEYNARIYDLNKPFLADSEKIRIYIVGDSFARDFANILIESDIGQKLEISYSSSIDDSIDVSNRFRSADFIFFSQESIVTVKEYSSKFNFAMSKVWNVGIKNFGFNNGIFYNRAHDSLYYKQRTRLIPGVFEKNQELSSQWGNRYINLIALIVDENKTVPVFTSECKFFSQDTAHLTKYGAMELAKLLNLSFIKKI